MEVVYKCRKLIRPCWTAAERHTPGLLLHDEFGGDIHFKIQISQSNIHLYCKHILMIESKVEFPSNFSDLDDKISLQLSPSAAAKAHIFNVSHEMHGLCDEGCSKNKVVQHIKHSCTASNKCSLNTELHALQRAIIGLCRHSPCLFQRCHRLFILSHFVPHTSLIITI